MTRDEADDIVGAIANLIDHLISDARPKHNRAPRDDRNYYEELALVLMGANQNDKAAP